MSRDTRWAARYQFLEECWRGQDRILLDAGLEQLLLGGGLDVSSLGHDPVTQLLDLLLPSRPSDGQAWMVLSHGRRAAELSRIRPETRFVSVSDAISVAAEDPWRLAMIDLGGFLGDGPISDADIEASDDDASDVVRRLDPEILALIETLGERAGAPGPSRMVAVSLPLVPVSFPGSGPDADLEAQRHIDGQIEGFSALVDELLPGARLFGIAWPQMAAIYNLAGGDEVPSSGLDPLDAYDAELDAAEADWTDDVQTQVFDAGDEDLSIDYDNTRADAVPRFAGLLAVLGPDVVVDGLGEGVTLLELPAEAPALPGAATSVGDSGGIDQLGTGREISELRTQLQQARRQAQMLSVEKQRLLEELDETRERLEGAVDGEGDAGAGAPRERLDLALAQQQQLRWELDRARERIGELEGRPVTTLEGDNEALRAQVEALRAEVARAKARGASRSDGEDDGKSRPRPGGDGARGSSTGRNGSGGRQRLRDVFAGQLDRLLRRVERGGISSLELHRTLRALKAALPRL